MGLSVHTGSGWVDLNNDTSGVRNIYTCTSDSSFNTRISNAYIHNGTNWVEVYTAYNSPPTGTFDLRFITTAPNNRTEAYIQWDALSGATSYEVWINGSPYTTTGTNLSATIPVSPNNSASSFNAYNFQVKAYNQFGSSPLSNTIRMVPGGIDVPFSLTYSSGVDTVLADVTASSSQTSGFISTMTFPSASSSFEAGYYRIDSMSVEIKPCQGYLSPTSTTGSGRRMGAKIDTSAVDWRNIIWDYSNGNAVSGYIPISTNVNLNSNNFGNQRIYFFVDGGGWTTSTTPNLTYAYYARNFRINGVRSTASTYS